jgi:hypothetical protein
VDANAHGTPVSVCQPGDGHASLSKVSAGGVGCHAEVRRDFAETHAARVELGGALHIHAAAVYGGNVCSQNGPDCAPVP